MHLAFPTLELQVKWEIPGWCVLHFCLVLSQHQTPVIKGLSPVLGSAHAQFLCVSALHPRAAPCAWSYHLGNLVNIMLLITFVQDEHRGGKSGQVKAHESSGKNLKLQKAKTLQKDGFCFSTASSGDTCFLLCSSAKCCYVCEFIRVV